MQTPTPAPRASLNFTLIIIVAMTLAAILVAVFLISNRGQSSLSLLGKPPLPLTVNWRETLGFGKTQVAVIQGKNDSPLGLIIEVERSVDGKTMTMEATLEPRGLLEVGFAQRKDLKNFVPGDRLILRNKNYATYEEICPR